MRGCHGEAGASMAAGTNALLFVNGVVFRNCLCLQLRVGGGNSVSSVFNCLRICVSLPVLSLAFDSVSSCRRLAGNRGT